MASPSVSSAAWWAASIAAIAASLSTTSAEPSAGASDSVSAGLELAATGVSPISSATAADGCQGTEASNDGGSGRVWAITAIWVGSA